jgi:hypothetical protein
MGDVRIKGISQIDDGGALEYQFAKDTNNISRDLSTNKLGGIRKPQM